MGQYRNASRARKGLGPLAKRVERKRKSWTFERLEDRLVFSVQSVSFSNQTPEGAALTLLRDAADAMRLSARGYHRVLRVARTLADLDGADKVGRVHLAEALSYRALTDEVRRAA